MELSDDCLCMIYHHTCPWHGYQLSRTCKRLYKLFMNHFRFIYGFSFSNLLVCCRRDYPQISLSCSPKMYILSTLLARATGHGYMNMIKLLVNAGVNMNEGVDIRDTIEWASKNGHINVLAFLINAGVLFDKIY
jgi:hypothetical protein